MFQWHNQGTSWHIAAGCWHIDPTEKPCGTWSYGHGFAMHMYVCMRCHACVHMNTHLCTLSTVKLAVDITAVNCELQKKLCQSLPSPSEKTPADKLAHHTELLGTLRIAKLQKIWHIMRHRRWQGWRCTSLRRLLGTASRLPRDSELVRSFSRLQKCSASADSVMLLSLGTTSGLCR